jgi:hypothetical protein
MYRKAAVLTLTMLCIIPPIATALGLPETGQLLCYDNSGNVIDCAGTGQDGAYSINPISYSDNGNGTVTDNITGLIWQKCSAGQNNDSTCSGPALYYNWFKASGIFDPNYNPSSQDICGVLDLGGSTDWRLPTKMELLGIVDYALASPGPTINLSYFPNTMASNFWSSSTPPATPGNAWGVHFNSGFANSFSKGDIDSVRCVRGGPSPLQSYVDNGDDTVTEASTGLMWQQGETGVMSWGASMSYCEASNLAGYSDWRLPNIVELASLIDETIYNPAINTLFFPNANASNYWSSTTNVSTPSSARVINFSDGNDDAYAKGNSFRCRCVRGGQGTLIDGTTSYYSTLQAVYENAPDPGTIKARAIAFVENLDCDLYKAVTLKGGYDEGYAANSGMTILKGTLTINRGSLTVENLEIS